MDNRDLPQDAALHREQKRLRIANQLMEQFRKQSLDSPYDLVEYARAHISKRTWERVARDARNMLAERCDFEF